LIWLSKD